MVHHDVVSQSAIAFLHESRNNHIVGSGPYAAFPVASVSLILRVVGSKRCHTVRTVELAGVVEMLHESVEALLGQHIGMQSPVSIDALRRRERVVGILVVEEAVALAPHVLVDVRREILYVVLELLYLLPALKVEAHLQQNVRHHYLLQAGVEPYHVTVAIDSVVAFGHTWHIVHARTPSAAPVCTVAPCAVELEPLVVGGKHGEHLVQTIVVAELRVVEPLRPRQQVRTSRCRVVATEAVGAVGAYLATDESVGMLLGVEVVERLLEREEAVAVAAEHRDERIVPHEDVAVVGGRDV